ncbi:ChaC-like protein [Guyanagaster necrorhizus]|uniref:glutathione-specific gamma-glutamylcyclotransferase n=1 Tax=Guyanagaster necrorhizus TaxID=856835 RepID=A0A9P7VFW3_9AGAR|nr:ChaC-like protein [Guyanagaster necrorhizus MCA 3950]KAG7439959.1 ChaC-like protein [Guyanagaster necrorhizus MCA 3950]
MASTTTTTTTAGTTERPPFIIFGYGSLIFKPPPHTIAKGKALGHGLPGFLKGYVRRFAQKSHDHRGTPENPGRVVTLIHIEDWDRFSGDDPFPHEDIVCGIAYTIDPAYESEVRDYLDYREKDGYTMETIDIYGLDTSDGKTDKAIIHNCYVGRIDNPSFLGAEPLPALAHTIWKSVGPSGPNKDYLYNLAIAVRQLSPESHDSHLFALEVKKKFLLHLDVTSSF